MGDDKKMPELCVAALIKNGAEKFLLVKSPKWQKWVLPGGHVEFGEGAEAAVEREVAEETALKVTGVKFLNFAEFVLSPDFDETKHLVGAVCFAETTDAEDAVKPEKEEIKEFCWKNASEILNDKDVHDYVKRAMRSYQDGGKLDEYLNGWKRAQADYQNLVKDVAKDKMDFVKYANQSLIMELLPVMDNFKAAFNLIPEAELKSAWVVGFLHIKKQMADFLAGNGVEEIKTVGEKLDVAIHEAVEYDEKSESPEGEIIAERKCGYKLNGRVIQAAKVVVSGKKE